MFRELTRKNKQLSADECLSILTQEKRGVLSVNGDDGYPYGMPMNHFFSPTDGCIYFHCGKTGHRLDSLRKDNKASFCVYDSGYKNQGEWALNIRSVIVFGKIEIIDDIDIIRSVTYDLSRKFTNDSEYIEKEITNHAGSTLLLKMTAEHICGKEVSES